MITFFPAPRPAGWPSRLKTQKAARADEELSRDPYQAFADKVTEPNTEKAAGAIKEMAAKTS
jgi:hypothetical protein